MSDAESRREDAKREQWEDDHPPPEINCPSCLDRAWTFMGRWVYGDDADGNRGITMETWECANGHEIEVTA